jgi:hypothetical protein
VYVSQGKHACIVVSKIVHLISIYVAGDSSHLVGSDLAIDLAHLHMSVGRFLLRHTILVVPSNLY